MTNNKPNPNRNCSALKCVDPDQPGIRAISALPDVTQIEVHEIVMARCRMTYCSCTYSFDVFTVFELLNCQVICR
jgi:hypothetical protein